MKRGKLPGTALMAVLLITALAATAASAAEPKLLKEDAEFSSSSGATVFGGGLAQVKCVKDKGTGKGTAEKAGEFKTAFEGCKDALGRTCTGLSDATAGTITISGQYDIRYWGLSKGEKNVAFLFLPLAVHFSCATTLIVFKGCVAGVIEPPYKKLAKELQVLLNVVAGDNVPLKVDNALNTAEENCEFKAEVEGAAATLWSVEGSETLSAFKKSLGGAGNEVEVMA